MKKKSILFVYWQNVRYILMQTSLLKKLRLTVKLTMIALVKISKRAEEMGTGNARGKTDLGN
jgi:hypothetical protein